eukprot:5243707-Amphidinium_carterae.2
MEEFVEQVKRYSKVTLALSSEEKESLCRAVVVLTSSLKRRAGKMLAESGGSPMMVQYGGDTTPLRVRQSDTAVSGDIRGRVAGMRSLELFVQQLFITCAVDSRERKYTVLLREPIVLAHGKSMRALIACALEGLDGIGLAGGYPDRICIYHSVMDRAMVGTFRHCLSGYWAESESEGDAGSGGIDLLRCDSWMLSARLPQ